MPSPHASGAEIWNSPLRITVDGPAGSGKSTVARRLAESLGYAFVDTGATYRALAWLALDRGIPLDAADRLAGLATAQPATLYHADDAWRVQIAGEDVTERIRSAEVGDAASRVARHDQVRSVLVEQQRAIAGGRDAVIDGRDAGTRVFPDANMKLFVTADTDERIRRRVDELGVRGGDARRVGTLLRERDTRDSPQSAAASDAVVIDTTGRSREDVLDDVLQRWLSYRRGLLGGEITGGKTADEWIAGAKREAFESWYRNLGWFFKRFFRLEVHGAERVPEGGCLIVANHSSMWDPAFLIMPLHEPVRFMAKVEATKVPVYNRGMDAIGGFPVRRGVGDRVALHIGEEILRHGDKLGIFPEGTRVYGEQLGRPKRGAARLALVAGVPVVPAAIYGTRYADTAFKVRVSFGRPHDFSSVPATADNVARATYEAWADVEEMWLAMRRGSRP